ncbi:MAG: zinc ribbon domain-containing protein [Candidatus Brennerbacteria bacterium]|nr:zinc ribbon domain-containing protein [Candidatus Brennerbacteria bacterium]
MDITCLSCHKVISDSANFCPQCGIKLKEPALSTSIGKQILIYFISFFLAPFGLHYAIKYIRQSDHKVKIVGIVSFILTVSAIALMFWITSSFMNALYQPLNFNGF